MREKKIWATAACNVIVALGSPPQGREFKNLLKTKNQLLYSVVKWDLTDLFIAKYKCVAEYNNQGFTLSGPLLPGSYNDSITFLQHNDLPLLSYTPVDYFIHLNAFHLEPCVNFK